MYLKFFGFREPPFKLSPDPRFFFFSKRHDEAFSHILYGLKERKGFIVIIGEVGTGKTTLCRLLLNKIDPTVRSALLFNPQLSTIELLQSINQDFGLPGESQSKKVLLDELNRFLLDLLSQGGNALLIIDEAQLLSVECLEEIRLLSNLETDQEKLIQILLIGQPELKEKLAMKELRQLKQRISLIYEIEPMERDEVAAYIQARIQVAGGEGKAGFDPKAIDRIYRFSHGYPRLINIIADQALLAAYVANTTYVTESFVRQASDELKKADLPSDAGFADAGPAGGKWVPYWAFSFILLLAFLGVMWSRKEGLFSEPGRTLSSSQTQTESPLRAEPSAPSATDPPPVLPEAPAPLADARPAAPATPRPLLDQDGIVRVAAVSETEKGAYLTLLNLWGALPPDEPWREKEVESIVGWLKEAGFASYAVPLDLKKVSVLNTPLLFSTAEEKGLHYQVLAKIDGEEAFLLDPLEGKRTISLQRLAEKWKGNGILLWKKVEGVAPSFQPDGAAQAGPDPSVKAIQALLKKEGLYADPVDGFWGTQTSRALLFFQEKEGLNEEGLWGAETEILLAQRSQRPGPTLKPKPTADGASEPNQ